MTAQWIIQAARLPIPWPDAPAAYDEALAKVRVWWAAHKHEYNPPASAPSGGPASPATQGEGLPVGNATFGGLRIGEYPRDQAKAGLYAIGLYSRTRMPPLNLLYERAAGENVPAGWNELIGRLPDDYTPLKILRFTRAGNEFRIEVALSPDKPDKSNYIWGELPRDLPPGRYHVLLTGYECEWKDGQLVPAPKTTIRAFYQLEC